MSELLRLAVVPCSARKLDRPPPAGGLELLAGLALAGAGRVERVLVLSAKHGLLELEETLEPYSLRMGEPGSVTAGQLAQELDELRRGGHLELVPLLPRDYARELERAAVKLWPFVGLAPNPLAGSRGLLEQRRRLRELREEAAS